MEKDFNILEKGSLLWKLASSKGYDCVTRRWGDDGNMFRLVFFKPETASGYQMFGCDDMLRPVSTKRDIMFKIENDDDLEIATNDKMFEIIGEIVEDESINICAGDKVLWSKDVCIEEMKVKLDLMECSYEH